MQTVSEVLKQCEFLIGKGAADQPASLFLPKQERLRRKLNREKYHRIVFEVTPEEYTNWHEMKERYFELVGNKTIALHIMVRVLAAISDEAIRNLCEEGL